MRVKNVQGAFARASVPNMLAAVLAVVGLQLNGWFRYADVWRRLPGSNPRATHLYGDVGAYAGKIAPTAVPEHAVVVFKDDRVHGFLHDSQDIRHCLWDGELEMREKIKIAASMLRWLHPEKSVSHSVCSYEDGVVLTMAKQYLHMTDNATVW